MPTLADIYSTIGSLKRRGADFIQNPVLGAQQMVGNANDQARALNQLTAESAQEGLSYGPKTKLLASQLAEGYNPTGMTVYHGSPYKFAKFDANKIGTGEGAQAYGHGIYVAENPNVANQYAKNVKDLDSIQSYNQRLKQLSKMMDEDSVYPGAYRTFNSEKGKKAAQEYDAVLEMRNQKSTDPGNLYKIDLPDEHIEKMLDWDMPLSKQHPEIQNAIKNVENLRTQKVLNARIETKKDLLEQNKNIDIVDRQIQILKEEMENPTLPSASGESYYKMLRNQLGDQIKASETLKNLGIPGIKYLDQNSRGLSQGTRNFVIFPGHEGLLKIQDINGNFIK
jgi:hypothetical protein